MSQHDSTTKKRSTAIKLAAKEASDRVSDGKADPGPGDLSAAPSSAPVSIHLPDPPTASQLVVPSSTLPPSAINSITSGRKTSSTVNAPSEGSGGKSGSALNASGTEASKSRSKSNTGGNETSQAPADENAENPSEVQKASASDKFKASTMNKASSVASSSHKSRQSSIPADKSSSMVQQASKSRSNASSPGSKSPVEPVENVSPEEQELASEEGNESPAQSEANSDSKVTSAKGGGKTIVPDTDAGRQASRKSGVRLFPQTKSKSSSKKLRSTKTLSITDPLKSEPHTKSMAIPSINTMLKSVPNSKTTDESNSDLLKSMSPGGGQLLASTVVGKDGKAMTKFKYHKRITVHTKGNKSPASVMHKVNQKDHKAGITMSTIDDLDPAEVMRRAGLKPESKGHWRLRLRETQKITKNGKTTMQTKIAYRDSFGNKDVKTVGSNDCHRCGKDKSECKCSEEQPK